MPGNCQSVAAFRDVQFGFVPMEMMAGEAVVYALLRCMINQSQTDALWFQPAVYSNNS